MNQYITRVHEVEHRGHLYLGFGVTDDDDLIRRAFEARFGYPPDEIITTGGSKNAGPVREGQGY